MLRQLRYAVRHQISQLFNTMKFCASSLALFAVLSAAAFAASPGVEVTWATQPDSPLRVVRIVSSLPNPIGEIAVKNASKKDIMSYQLGWVPVVPPGCGVPMKASPILLPVIRGPVWPSIGESAHSYDFDRNKVVELARKWNSRKILVVVVVVKVELSDGWWNHSADDLRNASVVGRFACR
jgi:hypothetical protein